MDFGCQKAPQGGWSGREMAGDGTWRRDRCGKSRKKAHYCVLYTQVLKQWKVGEAIRRALSGGEGEVFYPYRELWWNGQGNIEADGSGAMRKEAVMGIYIDPGNDGFREVVNGEYVDKTGLIDLINQTIGTKNKLVCVSRPRRFGKSIAAQMLCAYYDCSCDSHALFDDKVIARTKGYEEHLNRYHVINLDITGFISEAKVRTGSMADVPNMVVDAVHKELGQLLPERPEGGSLVEDLVHCVEATGRKFVFIIDEWDALIREAKGDARTLGKYLSLLREWFKNSSFTPKVVAAAYMTGILPIKKDGSQSAISDFREITILDPGRFAPYTGFTEEEVAGLCEKYGMDFGDAKKWYDGYDLPRVGAVYNPYSVMLAMQNQRYGSYWRKTSAAESLISYINMDFEGLQEIVSRLIAGEEIEVDTGDFKNDFETFGRADDVLTLLIHLGYLTWNEETGTARIPNEEVRSEFRGIIKNSHTGQCWAELIGRSKTLLADTLAGRTDEVAAAIEAVRDTQYAPTFYNDEQALRYVVKFAYIAALEQYVSIEELPSGHGIADVVFLPKRLSRVPALVVELKWGQSSEGAIRQIREKNYPAVLQGYGGEIVLAGINYDEKSKRHSCRIERV